MKVTVLYGGPSAEREISLISGQAATFGKAWLPDSAMLIIYVVMALWAFHARGHCASNSSR